ncbi:hypothetical protein EDD53_2796 [Pacificibacter maritimus]|uniref:LPXTG-motif cell wall-anchored protein n=1 Tax=Pacificibacter maritimus TaxID=762213 RepID=A0A3N4U8A3_9RHOB|nr:DUF6732 family protein [Pacificibacter maritimus]RPE63199.1 hypothetical protein EDD53_2796 [Pacificibacter maritimus]
MRHLITVAFTLIAAPALAHVGHVGELAGHDHWIAGAALGAAAGIAIWGALKGKKKAAQQDKIDAEVSDDADSDLQEA